MRVFLLIAGLVGLGMFHGCKKETVSPFDLLSLKADTVDLLNTTNAYINIKSPIVAIFGADIDPKSVTPSSVTITRLYDNASVPLTLIVSKSAMNIKSTSDLVSGTAYLLTITSAVTSTHGVAFASYSTNFSTAGSFVPSGQKSYWNFENNPQDVIGTLDPVATDVVGIYYVNGRSAAAGKAASFNGANSIIEVAGGSSLLGPEFTISFWMLLDNKATQSKRRSSYVLGIGNYHGMEFDVDSTFNWCRFSQGYQYLLSDNKSKSSITDDFQYFGDGNVDAANPVNQPIHSAGIKSRLDSVWAHIVMSFEDTLRYRKLYINGELMFKQDINYLSSKNADSIVVQLNTVTGLKFIPDTATPARYDDKLVFGFWQNKEATYGEPSGNYKNIDANHFKGLLDDVRFFNRTLTDTEVQMIYNDEKP